MVNLEDLKIGGQPLVEDSNFGIIVLWLKARMAGKSREDFFKWLIERENGSITEAELKDFYSWTDSVGNKNLRMPDIKSQFNFMCLGLIDEYKSEINSYYGTDKVKDVEFN